jgi:hypothetical protein
MAEGLQKKNLETAPDETRTFDHGELRTATIGEFKVATSERYVSYSFLVGIHLNTFS